MRFLLLAIAIASFVLTYMVVREHQRPPGQIELEWGWYVALVGSLLMLVGAGLRSGETERWRTPP